MHRFIWNLLRYGKWTDCQHPVWFTWKSGHSACMKCGAWK